MYQNNKHAGQTNRLQSIVPNPTTCFILIGPPIPDSVEQPPQAATQNVPRRVLHRPAMASGRRPNARKHVWLRSEPFWHLYLQKAGLPAQNPPCWSSQSRLNLVLEINQACSLFQRRSAPKGSSRVSPRRGESVFARLQRRKGPVRDTARLQVQPGQKKVLPVGRLSQSLVQAQRSPSEAGTGQKRELVACASPVRPNQKIDARTRPTHGYAKGTGSIKRRFAAGR